MGSTELGAAIEDGTAIGEDRRGSELLGMPGVRLRVVLRLRARNGRRRLGRDGGRERGSLAVLLRPDLRPGSGHPSAALINVRHTSVMSATPTRPASLATGR